MAGQRLMCAKAVGGHDRQQKKRRSGAGSAAGKAELREGSTVGGGTDPSSPKRRGLALAFMGLPHHWGVLPSPPQRSLASSLHHSRLDKGVSEMLHDATGCGHVRTPKDGGISRDQKLPLGIWERAGSNLNGVSCPRVCVEVQSLAEKTWGRPVSGSYLTPSKTSTEK